MNLTNVARSSIDEARKEFRKHLTRHAAPVAGRRARLHR